MMTYSSSLAPHGRCNICTKPRPFQASGWRHNGIVAGEHSWTCPDCMRRWKA